MKNLFYIFITFILAFTACQDEVVLRESEIKGDLVSIGFSLNLPEFTVATRAADVDSYSYLSLICFDTNDKYLSTVTVSGNSNTAMVLKKTKRIHFILHANQICPVTMVSGDDADEMKTMLISEQVAWGEIGVMSNLNTISSVTMIRNFARIKIGIAEGVDFDIDGILLGHYATTGTVAATRGFVNVPSSVSFTNQSTIQKTDMLYTFESKNTYDAPTFVIVKKKGAEEYYKIHLLDSEKIPYQIERNYSYNIKIRAYNQGVGGSTNIESALLAPPANNIFAEVIKESPVISDSNGNKLEIVGGKMVYLFTSAATLSVQTKFTGSGSSDAKTEIKILSDDGILENNLKNNGDGSFAVGVKQITEGDPQKAEIRVSNGELARVITVYSSQLYKFGTENLSFTYQNMDNVYTLDFTIPSDYPEALLPVECEITTTTLHPVSDKDMLVQRDGTNYKYVYLARKIGSYNLTFMPSYGWGSETMSLSNSYFQNVNVSVNGPASGDNPQPDPDPKPEPEDIIYTKIFRHYRVGIDIYPTWDDSKIINYPGAYVIQKDTEPIIIEWNQDGSQHKVSIATIYADGTAKINFGKEAPSPDTVLTISGIVWRGSNYEQKFEANAEIRYEDFAKPGDIILSGRRLP